MSGIAVHLPLGSALTFTLVQYAMDLGIIIVIAGMLLCVLRLLKGPHLADRAIAADALATHLMGLLVLFTMRGGTLLLFDGVVVLALLGFLTTVAFAQHILRPYARRVQHGEQPHPRVEAERVQRDQQQQQHQHNQKEEPS